MRRIDLRRIRASSNAVAAGAAVLSSLIIAGCSSGGAGPTTSPAQRSSASASGAPTSTADPRSGWSSVSHFVGANDDTYVAALRIPPGWHYVPAPRSNNCATT